MHESIGRAVFDWKYLPYSRLGGSVRVIATLHTRNKASLSVKLVIDHIERTALGHVLAIQVVQHSVQRVVDSELQFLDQHLEWL
jgi:hypothetical protein